MLKKLANLIEKKASFKLLYYLLMVFLFFQSFVFFTNFLNWQSVKGISYEKTYTNLILFILFLGSCFVLGFLKDKINKQKELSKKVSKDLKTCRKKISSLYKKLQNSSKEQKLKLSGFALLILVVFIFLKSYGFYFLPPKVTVTYPDNNSQDVPLQTTFSLQFSKPMLKKSVENSIVFTPEIPGEYKWLNKQTLEYQLSKPLKRGEYYELEFTKPYFSQFLIPGLKKPTINFQTVGHPKVALATPNTEAPDLKTPITVVFDRNMRPLTTTAEKKEFTPAFTLEPEVPGRGKWLGTSAYQFRPKEELQPATTYSYTIKKGLPSEDGGKIQKDLVFNFSTPRPRVLRTTPAENYDFADPTASIAAKFNLPISFQSAQEKFHLYLVENNQNKEIPGRIVLKNNFLGFYPLAPLKRKAKYNAVIEDGLKTTLGPNPTQRTYSWTFKTAPLPQVLSSEPKNNSRAVLEKHNIEINFASPMDRDSFAENVLITPEPEEEPYIYFRSYKDKHQLQISTYLKRNSNYQISLTQGVKDQHGVPLNKPYTLNFTTDHYKPALSIEPTNTYFASFNQKYIPRIVTKVVNSEKIKFKLYKLDKKSFFSLYNRRYDYNNYKNRDWQNYKPDALELVKEWEETFSAEQDQAVNVITKVTKEDNNKLESGLYFLDAWINDQVHDNLVMVVSNLNLNLKTADSQALTWAVDLNTGKTLADLDITLSRGYKKEFAQGKTNQDGVYLVKDNAKIIQPDNENPVWAFAENDQYWGMVNNNWGEGIEPYDFNIQRYWDSQVRTAEQEYTMHLQLDRPIYRPGQKVFFKGIVRSYADNQYSIPDQGAEISLIHKDSSYNIIKTETYQLNSNGTFSGSIQLGEDVGYHRLRIEYQNNSFEQSFQVEEYKKPDFKVAVDTEKDDYISGQNLQATINSNYYFGAPLTNAKIKWTLSTWDYPFTWQQHPRYAFGNNDSFWYTPWWRTSYGSADVISEGTGRTNAGGEYLVNIPLNINGKKATQKMRLEAVVTDQNEQAIANSKTFFVHHGELHIGLKPETYSGNAGEKRNIELAAVDTQGEVQADVPISLSIYKRTWKTIKEKDPDTGRFYWRSKPNDSLLETKQTETDQLGRAVVSFTPEEGGFYHLVAENNRTTPSSTNLWVSGKGIELPKNNHDRVPLVPDKYEYQVGEKASFQAGLEYQQATGLITLERENIVDYQIVNFSEDKQNFSIDLNGKHIPNTYITALFVKPAEGLKKPAEIKMGTSEVRVYNPEKKANVLIKTNKQEYQPKETLKIDLKTTNDQDKPISSEVSLALVDQAVWDLSTIEMPEAYDIFYRPRNLSVHTSSDLSLSMDRINANTNLGSKGGSGGGCFAGKTLILMADNTYKPIAQVSAGDYILTRKSAADPHLVKAKVAKTFIHDLEKYLLINNKLKTTREHIVYEQNKGWIPAGSLQPGDKLIDASNKQVEIKTVEQVKKPLRVYNLHNEKQHTFFAGNVWVHNQKSGGPATARNNFQDTAYWQAHLQTDENGNAHTEINLPDNTTTWRIIAQAVDKNTALGQEVKTITTSKELVIQPLLPRFAAFKDQPKIGMTVHNQTEQEKSVQAEFSGQGLKISANSSSQFKLAPKSKKTLFWDTEVNSTKNAQLLFTVKEGGKIADQVELNLPINTYYTKQTTAVSGQVNNYAEETIKIPEKIVPDQGSVDLSLSPALGANVQESADYLLSYPYDCNEQTSSQVLAYSSLIMLAKEKELDKVGEIKVSALEKQTQAKVNTLSSKQNRKGGWGWWSRFYPDPTISMLVMESLLQAQKAGFTVPETVLNKGFTYLQDELNQNKLTFDEKAAALSIISQAYPNKNSSAVNKLLDQRWQLSKTGRAYLLKTLIKQNRNSDAGILIDQLTSSGIQTNTSIHWEVDKKGYSILKSNIALTALMLDNLAEYNANNPLAEKTARWLINSQKDMHWVNTHNTAVAVQAFTKMWRKQSQGRLKLNWEFSLNNKKISQGEFEKDFFNTFVKSISIQELPQAEDIPLEIKKSGNGPLYYNLNYHYYLPDEEVKAEQQGLIVDREIINQQGETVNKFVKGENYWVRLILITPTAQNHLVIEDKLPAGFEAVNNSLATTALLNQNGPAKTKNRESLYFKNKEIRDDRVALFAQRVSPGVYEYTYKVRALHSGTYHLPATRAYNMYFPDIFGHSDGGILEIKE
jgi:uncharacterized protein YfaS (alpha-2-macroglobulin family)